jgi:hypothetical protein
MYTFEKKAVQIYKDGIEVPNNVLDLGIVPAGETKKFNFRVKNITKGILVNLSFIISNPEVKVIKAPEKLNYNEEADLILQWDASVTVETGLKDVPITIKGQYIG